MHVATPHPAAIEAHALARSFSSGPRRNRRTIDAVRGISFRVERGERLAFIGPNGAGKSTSIKMLTGILHPSGGSAVVLGTVPWEQRRELTRRIGTLFGQRSQLWQELSARASFRMLGAIYGLRDPEIVARVGELGELLDAGDLFDQPMRTLSLGQRMRCELAACMLHRPELLFLDEPTIGLDLIAKQRFRDLLLRLNRELGTTVFLTSHDVADIEHVADRAIVVNHGEIIYDAAVAMMRSELLATKRVDVGLARPDDGDRVRLALDTLPAGTVRSVSTVSASLIRIEVDTTLAPIRAVLDVVLASVAVSDLSVVDPPLERVIGEIYERPR
jgi:ABC-2 type transport system ATP-binding protein